MNKKIFVIILSIAVLMFFPGKIWASTWDDCPLGKTNDEYPGDCPRYVDSDNDGICDHSQLPPEEREQLTIDGDTGKIKDTQAQIPNYHINLIFFLVSGLYALTYVFSKKRIISLFTHKKVWNVLLTLSFTINFVSSLLLLLQLVCETRLNLPFNLTFWHIESGLVFILIAIAHIFWHIPYYRQVMKINKIK